MCCNGKNKTGLAHLAHGAVGLTKAIVGIYRAPAAGNEARRAICQQCDRATRHKDGVRVRRCLECSCWIKQAIKVASKDCPLGKWNKDASLPIQ
jgi:hypothetical protein